MSILLKEIQTLKDSNSYNHIKC